MSQVDRGEIARALGEYVLANYALGAEAAGLDPNHDLLASGVVDSMGVMEIIAFIEESFEVVVDDEDIIPENLRSLRAMTDYVAAKRDVALAKPRGPFPS